MDNFDKYEAVIGLEVHAQLKTKTKAYSSDENIYGAVPNTKTCPISLGHPGTLPIPNKKVIEYAVKMGLAVGSNIRERNEYARKNYFYADLPKGYQITQDQTPICDGGFIEIKKNNGQFKKINITRIHMEEDAGKSIHDLDPFSTLIDLNRAGVPLIEIVSEPEISNADEAQKYIQEIRKLVKYIDICDGNMEEGSLRCDANISVKLKNDTEFGTKVEVKNMNSTSNVKKAIEFEIKRQISILENGNTVDHETRSFNAISGETISLRHKEEANDYRYFPEPDIQPVIISKEYIEEIKQKLPILPKQLFEKFTNKYNLSSYDANILLEEKEIANYFMNVTQETKNYKSAANFIIGPIRSYLNESAKKISDINISAKNIAMLINLIDHGTISNSIAISKVFPVMIDSNMNPREIVESNNWIQNSNTDSLLILVKECINKYPNKVTEYKSGKKGLLGLFMGEVMKASNGNADPKLASKLIQQELNK